MGNIFTPGLEQARPHALPSAIFKNRGISVLDGTSGPQGCITAPMLSLAHLSSTGLALTSLLLAAPVQAAPAAGPAKTASKPDSKTKPGAAGSPAGTPRGNKQISLDDDFLVEGRLEKPSAFYVLRRSSTDYDWARLDAVFTPLVLESVQDPLF